MSGMFLFSRYLDRIIRSSDLQEFESMLLPHQKAITADGQEAFIIEHPHTHTCSCTHTCADSHVRISASTHTRTHAHTPFLPYPQYTQTDFSNINGEPPIYILTHFSDIIGEPPIHILTDFSDINGETPILHIDRLFRY